MPPGALVGVEQGDVVDEHLRLHFPAVRRRVFADQGSALAALARGEVDAVAGDYYVGLWHLQRLGLGGQVKAVGHPFMEGAYGMAVRKGDIALLAALDDAVAQVKESGASRRLQSAWFGEGYFQQGIPWQRVGVASAVAGALLLAMAVWIWLLRRAVRRATRELRASEERFRALVQHSPDGIVAAAGGKFVFVNPAALTILGASSPEQLLGQPVLERFPPAGRAVAGTRIEEIIARGAGVTLHETRVLRMDGTAVAVELSGTAIELDGRQGGLAILRDATRRHELEAQLRQSQKMEAVGRMAGGMAHDFNNLLTVILTSAELVRADAGPELSADLAAIRAAAQRGAALTRQLLAFSRRSVLRPRGVDLCDAVRDAARLLSRVLGDDVVLSLELPPAPAPVHADPDQLAQVLMNLGLNARDAMTGGGLLVLRVRTVHLDGSERAFGGAEVAAGAYVELAVRDQGVGMDQATRHRLFEPFFTTKEPGKGTGLGLSVVYGIVSQSGGHLDVITAPGAGSTFVVRLPRAEQASEPARPPGPPRDSARGTQETVLVVEDAAEVGRLVERSLVALGYRVLLAAHPRDALRLFEEREDEVALLLTDVVMPEMSGIELARALQARRAGLRVLLMSGQLDGQVAAAEGGFLAKPFQPQDLARAVATALGQPERPRPVAPAALRRPPPPSARA